MSVLIKGMKMPESCFYCPMREWHIIHGEKITSCRAAKTLITNEDELPSFCPIVPVPPHGRLIDADEFYKDINESILLTDAFKINFILWFDEQPTIIPAEEGE